MSFFEICDLASVVHGQEISLQGRVTRIDRNPSSDCIVSTDTFHLSDGLNFARILLLDPHAYNLSVGADVMAHRLLCTRTDNRSPLHIFATSNTVVSSVSRSVSRWNEPPERQECCATTYTVFCGSTGAPHVCEVCSLPRPHSPFCSMTGQRH